MKRLFNAALLLSVVLQHSVPIRCAGAADDATTAPAVKVLNVIAPKDLQARAAANVPRVELQWTDNVDGEAGFIVERSADGGKTFARIGRPRTNATGHIDHTVERDAAYAYRVRAIGPGWETTAATVETIRTADFQMFDAMLFQPKPDLRRIGIDSIDVAYAGEFSAAGGSFPHANEAMTRATARRAKRDGIVVIDIEHWPVDIRTAGEAQVEQGLAKLAAVIDWMRDERPDLKLGVYSVLPLRDYWTPVSYLTAKENAATPPAKLTELSREFDRWVEANAFARKRLGANVDFTFPSLYTFYEEQPGWELYAKANLAEARKVGKPVYPFLWMNYHNGTETLNGTLLPPKTWQSQLETCREQADGLVIWGGWDLKQNRPMRWHSQSPWWRATQDFLSD